MNKTAQVSGRFTALWIFLCLFILVGVFLPYAMASFVDLSSPNTDSIVYPLLSFIGGTIEFNVLGMSYEIGFLTFLPQVLQDYVSESNNAFTYLPDVLAVPLILVMVCCFVYVLLTLLPTVGG